jgi:hypothetical protein
MISIKIKNIPSSYNSKLLKVSLSNKNYVVKLFSKKNRLNFIREVFFLTNLRNLKNIPKIISYDYNKKTLVLSYLSGKKIRKDQGKYLPQIFYFLRKIQVKKNKYVNKNKIIKSKEGCYCLLDHLKNSKMKINEIKKNKQFMKNSNFLNFIKKLDNTYNLNEKNILKKYTKNNLKKEFNIKKLILSPSDFGFNNILLKSKKLFFLDFEYSGLDDPCKLCFDFISNPNTKFTSQEYEIFTHKFSTNFKIRNFKNIYNDFIDFYYIKWSILIFKYNCTKNNISNTNIDMALINTEKYLKNKKIWK